MKTLYLLRHAKAVPGDEGAQDFDRELAVRGVSDIQKIAKRFRQIFMAPQLIVSSPAVRAMQTAKLFAEGVRYKKKSLATEPRIYEANAPILLKLLQQIEDRYDSLMLVGHNPAFNDLAASLLKDFHQNIPTSGLLGIDFHVQRWQEVKRKSGVLTYFDYPKRSHAQKRLRQDLAANIAETIAQTLSAIQPEAAKQADKRIRKASQKIARKFVKSLPPQSEPMLGQQPAVEKSRKSSSGERKKATQNTQ